MFAARYFTPRYWPARYWPEVGGSATVIAAAAGSTSLLAYRRFAAREAGRYIQGTVDASGNSTTTAKVAALATSISADDVYKDYWFYLPAAGAGDKVRVVSGFTALTGTLAVDRAYSLSSVPDGKTFELHGVLRPFGDDLVETLDWTTAINDALKRCFVEWEFTVTPTERATRHDVSTANTWLTNPDWIKQVGVLGTNESRAEVDPYRTRAVRGESERQGSVVYLNHAPRTFSANEVIYVKAIRPAYSLCRAAGGTFGDQNGLSAETDEAPASVEWVAYAALEELGRRQPMLLAGAAEPDVAKRRKEWAALFSYYARKETGQLPELTFRPMLNVAVMRNTRGGR
jgi:hypothetical protein